ncbi:alpha/beta hydrolase family protein [Chitinimonas naiadis]
MSIQEDAIVFDCEGSELLGIIASSPLQARDCGVVIIVGGPQYRVGSHRQFLHLSRRLAEAGYPCMRFDYRGMGDSEGDGRDFESVSSDIAAAIKAFQQTRPDLKRIVLWGLCDAASAALLYWHERQDQRLIGLCLLNPWVRGEATQARAQVKHYYGQRLLQPAFWRKLLRGEVGVIRALAGLVSAMHRARSKAPCNTPNLPFPRRMAEGWRSYPGKLLLILSGQDYTAKEFLECANSEAAWSGLLDQHKVSRHDLLGADHTFSTAAGRAEVEQLTLNWLHTLMETA